MNTVIFVRLIFIRVRVFFRRDGCSLPVGCILALQGIANFASVVLHNTAVGDTAAPLLRGEITLGARDEVRSRETLIGQDEREGSR